MSASPDNDADEEVEDCRSIPSVVHVPEIPSERPPQDRTRVPTWFWEVPAGDGNVLTPDGVSQIAHHKYVPGDYTHLDELLNPFWTFCTETFLPKTMAPNMVTTLGGLSCLGAYLATWYYMPNLESPTGEEPVPAGLLVGNAMAVFLYYTLDCMDGKQARRTGTSSPLGQLFDHGIDCFANIALISIVESFLLHGPSWAYLSAQLGLQMVFFATQWEEYYTGVLPHAYGKFLGVTEVNYGLAVATLISSFMDNKAFYSQTLQKALYPILPISLLPYHKLEPDTFVTVWNGILTTPLKTCIHAVWMVTLASVLLGCLRRVALHIGQVGAFAVACSKLVSPLLVLYMVLVVTPLEAIHGEARYMSIAAGLCLCLITIKIIVFSMARMAYASYQIDVTPAVVVFGFIAWELDHAPKRRLTPRGVALLLQALSVWYLIRIGYWASIAIGQLCERLDVNLLTIKKKEKRT